jgi:hypothetical protein
MISLGKLTTVRILIISNCLAVLLTAACSNIYEIPIETPIRPKIDIAPFKQVLVAGFLSGGSDDVDANIETVRLLRSELRNQGELSVIDAEVVQLNETASSQLEDNPIIAGSSESEILQDQETLTTIENEETLELYEHIFADVEYWKRIGEEYQGPLIVTGTVMFMPYARAGFVQREEEIFDSFGQRLVVPVRTYEERKGFTLEPRFIFIDGRTGTTIYSETFREEVLYSADRATSELSSYFELMERLIPSFLSTLSNQSVRGTRILLK